MKKLMFNDKYGLTKSVLEGYKTQTRRIVQPVSYTMYKIGEEIAIAQPYKDVITTNISEFEKLPGWNNKMFVTPKLMPNRIKITNIRFEALQDISDEDCLCEGIRKEDNGYSFTGSKEIYQTPKEAYAALIDKVSGRGTWEKNVYVYVYDFELIK